MVTPLLTTKLYMPPSRPQLVSRPRLIERLNTGLQRRLTLVSAPAGFGKTTLLVEWLRGQAEAQPRLRVGWFSLDDDDNDPVRFLAYLTASLYLAGGATSLDDLAARRGPRSPNLRLALTLLINEVAGQASRIVLVLDDYHLVEVQPIHDAVAFLLDHLPENLNLVIAGRAGPPLPLSCLRVRGQMAELHQTDLCFTPEEAQVFLTQTMGLALSGEDVARLEQRTDRLLNLMIMFGGTP